jgi:fumarylacetoacetase
MSDGFGPENLPYGVFSAGSDGPRVGVRLGDDVINLSGLAAAGLLDGAAPDPAALFSAPALNPLMACGPAVWRTLRRRLQDVVGDGGHAAFTVPLESAVLHLPFEVADYVDFYSSLDHASNLGRMFRPDADPLLPNWRHLPVGYHGRAGTVVVSGTPIRRPNGQRRLPDGGIVVGPSTRLDIELEVGFVVGAPSRLGRPVAGSAVADHVFGVVLVNDWSARDIQAWEYQPLGPFLGRSSASPSPPRSRPGSCRWRPWPRPGWRRRRRSRRRPTTCRWPSHGASTWSWRWRCGPVPTVPSRS